MQRPPLPLYIQQLLEPERYPHPVETVTLLQTHVSYLMFAGDYVYKWKKPVNLGFVDFSTLEKREFFCQEEVRLNRRLCPNMYLGVVALCRAGDLVQLDGDGTPFEFGVKMRRLPAAKMMDRVIAAGELTLSHLTRIIDRLVVFHQDTPMVPVTSGYGDVRAVAGTIRDNFSETQAFVGGEALGEVRFRRIRDYAENFLHNRKRFAQRVAEGRIRDCHGDLHSGNICLTDEIAIFDCIEFNEGLRCTDIAADVAFLAMDLDFHNLRDLSNFFVDRYISCAGDEGLREMLDFYKCYRAYVRGKIGLLTAADQGVEQPDQEVAVTMANQYFQLAEEYASH